MPFSYGPRQESKLSVNSSSPSHFNASSDINTERTKAVALLQDHCSNQRKSNRNDDFTYQDVNAVLCELLQNPQELSTGLINALLGFEHDLNYSVRAKEGTGGIFRRKEGQRSETQRNNIVQQATENRNCPLGIWKLLVQKADQDTLREIFGISVQNNMVAKVDICLHISSAQKLRLNISEALMSAIGLASQTNSEAEYIRLIIVLLKWHNEDLRFKIADATAIATGAGHSKILQILLEHSASSRSSFRNPSFQSFPDHRASQSLVGVPQRLNDLGLLEKTCNGVPGACKEFLELLKSSESRIIRSSYSKLLGKMLQQCTTNLAWLPSQTLEVVGYLLLKGSYSPEVDAAFCRTMEHTDPARSVDSRDAAELLAHSALKITLNTVLDKIPLGPNFGDHDLWQLHSLIEWGASGESVHLALCLAIYARLGGRDSRSDNFIQTLISAEIDVNHEETEVLRVAADCGNLEVLEQLLAARSRPDSKAFAFAVAILAGHEESLLLALINQFTSSKSDPLVAKESPPKGYFPPLFVCLQLYPKSWRLLDTLVKAGCPVDTTIGYQPSEDYLKGPESINLLIFALCQVEWQVGQGKSIPSDVMDVLISECDNNFQTSGSKVTPLILAAKHGRKDVVAKLIKRRAKISATDSMERSALFYASKTGDLSSVEALIQAGAPADDGSLHEAARELHDDVVKTLIRKGHHVDSRSTNKAHGNRIALHEMLLKCNGNAGIIKIKQTILALTNGKLVAEDFFLALSNSTPIPLVKSFLSLSMGKELRNGDLVLECSADGLIFYFSPTTFIRNGLAYSPVEEQKTLLDEIAKFGGQDQFYAQQLSKQPINYIGAPQPIQQAEEDRRTKREMKINELPRSSRLKLRKEYEREDKQYADAQKAIVEGFRRQAEEKSQAMMADEELMRQRQANLKILRERQLSVNLRIHQGNAVTRREHHKASLTERRHMSFLRGVDTFSERERRIAGGRYDK